MEPVSGACHCVMPKKSGIFSQEENLTDHSLNYEWICIHDHDGW